MFATVAVPRTGANVQEGGWQTAAGMSVPPARRQSSLPIATSPTPRSALASLPIAGRSVLAEAVATAMLVLVGCGAIMVDAAGILPLGVAGIALAFGLVVAAMVALFGSVSGAHINPAVTLALWARGRIDRRTALCYVPAQITGALVAAVVLWAFDPTSRLGTTAFAPEIPTWSSWLLEAVATAALAFVILFVATGRPMHRIVAPLAIGGVVGVAAFALGPWTGASLNPARSLGPALVSGHMDGLLPFLVAPVVGALVGAWLACVLLPATHCCADQAPGACPVEVAT